MGAKDRDDGGGVPGAGSAGAAGVEGDESVEGGEGADPLRLSTVGHGTLDAGRFATLLVASGVEVLVDVRSHPGSRRHPHFGRAAMEQWVPTSGIRYRWEPRLGGRRRTRPDSPHVALRNASFRGYADHMASEEFRAGLDDVLAEAVRARVAVMCSESLWWRCHRRLIADRLVAAGGVVRHILPDGSSELHQVWDLARPAGDGLVYPPEQGELSLGPPPHDD